MGDASGSPPIVHDAGIKKSEQQPEQEKAWHSYLPRSVLESTDSAIRSARSLQHNSATHLRALQDFVPQIQSQYRTFEDAFFRKVKDEFVGAREHGAVAVGLIITAGFLLMRGPRRFLFRHTWGRLQSEEAQFVRAEKNVKGLILSVDLMKKESRKLLERAALAEKDMKHGHAELMSTGTQIQGLATLVYKAEAEAANLMDVLREIPGREALRLRADVASMASFLRQQRTAVDKKIIKISELGVPV